MTSFQAKTGWKMPRKRKKIKKIPLRLYFKPKQDGKGREREKIKIIVPFCSHQTRKRKFEKNQQNNEKNDKNPLWRHFKAKQVGKG